MNPGESAGSLAAEEAEEGGEDKGGKDGQEERSADGRGGTNLAISRVRDAVRDSFFF